MEKTICKGLKKLESCGVTFIAMPCNTAHRYFRTLKQSIQVPLLNMVELTLSRIPKSAKKVTVLGTRSTLESEVYQNGLGTARQNFVLNPGWQTQIDEMLLSIKSSSDHLAATKSWKKLCEELRVAEVDAAVIACTDLNVVINQANSPLKIVDSSFALAEAIVHQWGK